MKYLLAIVCALAAAPAAGKVSNLGEHGFTVTHTAEVESEPFFVWRTMTSHIDQWWSKDHSWTGNAANLYMKVERGGCFCEKYPNGGEAEHLRIIHFVPGREIRFDGALGPLQSMAVNGRMIWNIEKTETGSRITFTYHVFGHPEGGLAGIAPAVDGVIGQQLERLAEHLDWHQK